MESMQHEMETTSVYRPPSHLRLAVDSKSHTVHFVSDASTSKSKNAEVSRKAALNFMRGVMDECTHLGNFSIPVDPTLVIIAMAKHDAYMPRNNLIGLHELWPGSELRELDSGHIAAFLFKQKAFRLVS
jgi:hypothetical protein